MVATVPSRLAQDIEALIALDAEGRDIGDIARLLYRDVEWCERQLRFKRQADEKAAADRQRVERAKALKLARFKEAAARGRAIVAANRKLKREGGR